MTLKNGTKFKEKRTRGLKNYIRNLINFHASSWKSEKLHFDVFLLSKEYKFLMNKNRRVMSRDTEKGRSDLKKNWLFVPKVMPEVWCILMRAVASLKSCTLMLCVITLKNDGKFEEKLTFALKMTWRIWRVLTKLSKVSKFAL